MLRWTSGGVTNFSPKRGWFLKPKLQTIGGLRNKYTLYNIYIYIHTRKWLNHPHWKICSSKWISSSPRIGVKIKNIWNHHHYIYIYYTPRQLANITTISSNQNPFEGSKCLPYHEDPSVCSASDGVAGESGLTKDLWNGSLNHAMGSKRRCLIIAISYNDL